MRLENLHINRSWDDKKVEGPVKFKDATTNTIELHLTEAHCAAILAICAEALANISKNATRAMTSNIFSQLHPAIEHDDSIHS